MTLRRAIEADVPDIRALTLRAYAKWSGVTAQPPRPMRADYARAFRDHRFDVLIERGALIALIETVPQGDELLIINVAVDPELQGRGLGARMMRHAEDLARTQGLTGTRLYTNKLMAANIALYERLGYRFEKEAPTDEGAIAVHMVRNLGPAPGGSAES